jgi:hypothetical protein
MIESSGVGCCSLGEGKEPCDSSMTRRVSGGIPGKEENQMSMLNDKTEAT